MSTKLFSEWVSARCAEGWTFDGRFDAPLNAMYSDQGGHFTAPDGAGSYWFVASRLPEPLPWRDDPGDCGYGPQEPGRLTLSFSGGEDVVIEFGTYVPGDDEIVEGA